MTYEFTKQDREALLKQYPGPWKLGPSPYDVHAKKMELVFFGTPNDELLARFIRDCGNSAAEAIDVPACPWITKSLFDRVEADFPFPWVCAREEGETGLVAVIKAANDRKIICGTNTSAPVLDLIVLAVHSAREVLHGRLPESDPLASLSPAQAKVFENLQEQLKTTAEQRDKFRHERDHSEEQERRLNARILLFENKNANQAAALDKPRLQDVAKIHELERERDQLLAERNDARAALDVARNSAETQANILAATLRDCEALKARNDEACNQVANLNARITQGIRTNEELVRANGELNQSVIAVQRALKHQDDNTEQNRAAVVAWRERFEKAIAQTERAMDKVEKFLGQVIEARNERDQALKDLNDCANMKVQGYEDAEKCKAAVDSWFYSLTKRVENDTQKKLEHMQERFTEYAEFLSRTDERNRITTNEKMLRNTLEWFCHELNLKFSWNPNGSPTPIQHLEAITHRLRKQAPFARPLDAKKVLRDNPGEFAYLVALEAAAARKLYPQKWNSPHQAYGLLTEELAEFFEEVRKKRADRSPVAIVRELVQIAFCAQRAAEDLYPESLMELYDKAPDMSEVEN